MKLPAVESFAARFHDAKPFKHVVLDDVISQETLVALRAACAGLAWMPRSDEILLGLTAQRPASGAIARVADQLRAPQQLAAWSKLVGKELTDLILMPWRYVPGCYLLPHTDADTQHERGLAFVLHLTEASNAERHGGASASKDVNDSGALETDVMGGDLVLYDTQSQGCQAAKRIGVRPGRLVIFEPTDHALHAVDEVREGDRLTLAGWLISAGGAAHLASMAPALPQPPTHVADAPDTQPTADRLTAKRCADARARARLAKLRRRDIPDRGRFTWAPAALDDPLVMATAAWARGATGRPLVARRARWLRFGAGDYALRLDDQLERCVDETAHAVIDISADAQGLALPMWQRGAFAILARPQAPGERVVVMRSAGIDFWQRYVSVTIADADVWRLEIGFHIETIKNIEI